MMKQAVTLDNWQTGPVNRHTSGRMREIVPTARVAASRNPLPLAEDGRTLDIDTFGSVLRDTYTDGFMVLHDGAIRAECYPGDLEPGRPHMLYSVSKSIIGAVTAVLIDRGRLDMHAQITSYIPELAVSGYAGATVRHLLDMRSGIRFREEYLDPDAEVRHLDQALGWVPRTSPDGPATLYEYLPRLRQQRPHGGAFEYRSCETDVLGWVCERAAGRRMPELLSDVLWSRFAEDDMDAGVDRAGNVFHDGGLAASLRDAARFGELLRTRTIVPRAWIEDALTGDPDSRAAFAASPTDTGLPGGMYRNQFWVPYADRRVLMCLGIHGQLIYVDFDRAVVVAKLSSWPTPLDPALDTATLALAEAACAAAQAVGPARPGSGRTVER
ncbi:MAG: class C beta-lactamase-related serine hydrolase [Mycolicibacterium mageritense]|nr:serine hydrolase [Mycolicibacterium mageritense]TXI64080.1 MAG: class C beta-lactamase-related serine hydrolase [Mycolicibacterium mageritense]